MATIVSPCVRSHTIPRCTTEGDWLVNDMAVRGNKLAVCGYKVRTDTSYIDLFTLTDPDSSSPLMTQLFTKVFNHPRWRSNYRCVSFLDDSRIVTVCGDVVQIYYIEADDSEPLHTVNLLHDTPARCMTVREGEIFIGFSKEVIVFDFSLNKIKTITLEGLEGYPVDITVYVDNLFISTGGWGATARYNMEGKIVHKFNAHRHSDAWSITVSGLVYILWGVRHVVVYSLFDSRQLMSFDVDRSIRIRIVDVNRLLTVYRTGEVREYSMPPDVLTLLHESLQKIFAEMTRSDSENLANFFMFPLKHVKAIINSPSHSKDLLVELENKGIIQSALTDELCENLGALNIKLLTGRSKERYPSIDMSSSALLMREMQMVTEGEEGIGNYFSSPPSAYFNLNTAAEEEDWKPPDTMEITSSISGKGGLLQIPNTGIKLVFPPNAVTEEHNIQVKIISPSVLNEPATSFSSNSSVVLELLPNGLQLKHEVSLTLPHCLTFINEEKAKAKVYVSHHEEGQRPCWEERPLSPYIFHRSKCTVRLLDFCWLKIVIDDTEVEAKDIVVYAANKILNDKETARVSIGYYEDLPGREPKILKLNPDLKLVQSLLCTIFKEGNQPLTISFNGTNPHNTWCTEQGNARQEIPWGYLYLSKEFLVHFELQRRQSRDSLCKFTAQQGNSDPIKFSIEMENLSRGEIADSTVPYYILEYVATELAEEWQRLARGLDISDADLHNIKTNNSGHMQDTKYFMLHKWRKRNGAGATCTVLAEALDKAGRKDLQQYVKRQVTMQGRNVPTQDS